jgi:hypothetical protein
VISLSSLVWALRKRGKEKKIEIEIWGWRFMLFCNVGHWDLRAQRCAVTVNASIFTFPYIGGKEERK